MFQVVKDNNNPEIQETFRFQYSPASKQPLLLQVNFASHFIRIQIFQINLPLILYASKYFR